MELADVAIIGGSFSGLSAALFLANARRNVVVIDAGNPANAPAKQMHNLIGSESVPPLVFLANVRKELEPYPNLMFTTDIAIAIQPQKDFFRIKTAKKIINAKKVIIATGIRHILPEIKNIAEFWVHNVFHCPYCFGPEVIDEPLAIYCTKNPIKQVLLIRKWSDDCILLTDGHPISTREKKIFNEINIPVFSEKIKSFSGEANRFIRIHFGNGEQIERRGIFMHPDIEQTIPKIVNALKLKLTPGGLLKVNKEYETNVAGIYAAGDATNDIQKVPTAISSGSMAGFYVDAALSKSLIAP